jgi:hypothetical protein
MAVKIRSTFFPWESRMVRTFLAAAILFGTFTLAQAQGLQSVSAPLVVTATVVSSCKVKVPRHVERSAFPTMPVDIRCAREAGADARVQRPPAPQTTVGHALVVINF